jgi:hypothetical protein
VLPHRPPEWSVATGGMGGGGGRARDRELTHESSRRRQGIVVRAKNNTEVEVASQLYMEGWMEAGA